MIGSDLNTLPHLIKKTSMLVCKVLVYLGDCLGYYFVIPRFLLSDSHLAILLPVRSRC